MNTFPRTRISSLNICLLLVAAGCSDEVFVVQPRPMGPEVPVDETPDGEPSNDDDPELPPLYALSTNVYQPDESVMSYITLTDTLDLTELPEESAREFASYAFVSGFEGKLLVSDGESPEIVRYEITPQLDWVEEDRVSFAGEGITGGAAGFERHWFVDDTTAYVTLDVTKRVIWSPRDMVVSGVAEDSTLPLERDGLVLDATFNRQPRRLRGPTLKPFYYRDDAWYMFGQYTSIAVYDSETHAEQKVIDVPCPSLEVPSQDELGNTYFSAWTYGPELGLFGQGPATCVRRIKPDATLDEDWAPDLAEWTGGRPVHVFRYMRDGKAVGTVLHVDEVDIDFDAGYDEEKAGELAAHWRLWLFDLEAETAQPIEGIEGISGGWYWANFDGRTFLFVPDAEWSSSKVFELDSDGNASERFQATGFITDWIRIR
jgi:hypothetical protein